MNRTFFLMTLCFLTFQVFGQDYMYINTETLNVRENAGKEYDVVGKVNKGDKVIVITESDNWTEIETENGLKGYVASQYLSNVERQEDSKASSWIGILVFLFFIFYAGFKVKNYFSGLFGGGQSSSSNSSRNKSREEPLRQSATTSNKPNPLHWYHCKNCNIKIEALKLPTNQNCSAEPFHKWTDLGEVGNQAYSCKNCGTTVYTNKLPTNQNCSRASFHNWTKLS